MRDGLHKDLPLGRAWQGVVKACEREAERGETARTRATTALASDVRKEVSEGFIRQLVQTADNGHHCCPASTLSRQKQRHDSCRVRTPTGERDHRKREATRKQRTTGDHWLARLSRSTQGSSENRARQIEQTCHSAERVLARLLVRQPTR